MRNKRFLYTFFLYSSYVWFTTFGGSILPTHFLQQGLDFKQMIFGKVLVFAAQAALLLSLTSFWSRRAWKLAPVMILAYILLSIKILNVYQFFLANIFVGAALYFFYVFYNIAHFENTPKEKRGLSSSIMFALPVSINLFAPVFAGFVATINLSALWFLAGFFFLISFYAANFPENFSITYSVKAALQEIKATRWLIFIEGIWEALLMGVVPIYTLFFIKEPLPYGIYLAYLSLVGVAANLLLGRFTDKVQKRAFFLYPITLILVGVTFFFDLATKDLLLWSVAGGALAFMVPLFWNISTAMVVDIHPNLRLAIPGRELVLAVGRMIGLSLVFISFFFETIPHYIFFILAGVLLVYPLILFWNTQISKKYRYL